MRDDTQKLLTLEGAPLPPQPDRDAAGRLTIDGLVIEANELNPGESVAQTVYWLPQSRTLVGADVATPTLIPFVAEGRTGPWLDALKTVQARYPATARLLPGHGPEGRLGDLASAQARYLTEYRTAIGKAADRTSPGGTTVTPAEQAGIDRRMAAQFATKGEVAGLPPPKLSQMNAQAVAKELASAR